MFLLLLLVLLPTILGEKITEEENERLKATCGNRSLKPKMVPKASPGRKVEPNVYPWIAAVEYPKEDGKTSVCTAVLISSRHILTAAHCVLKDIPKKESEKICSEIGYMAKPAMGNQTYREELTRLLYNHIPPEMITVYVSSSCGNIRQCQIKFTITKWPHVHEKYNHCKFYNDLAIIELDQDVPAATGTPICIVEEDDSLMQNLTSIGYGSDPSHNMQTFNDLEEIIIASEDVIESNGQLSVSLYNKSTCAGDSGGPLVQTNREHRFTLVGITNAGTPCEKPITPRKSIFADIRRNVNWICTNTGICPIKKMGSYADHTDSPSEWIRSSKFGRHLSE